MGAEVSDLGQYTLEDPVEDGPWVVKQGVSDVDDTSITVFTDESGDKQKKQMFHRYIKLLKSLRHPCILHYLSSGEVSSGSYLVTERVISLRHVVDTLAPVEICAGLFDILQGLSFLHEKANMSHNNICMESIYVSSSGQWKIGGLEHACKYTDVTPDFLSSTKKYRNERSISPEEKEGKMNTSVDLGHSRDVYSFAVLAEILLEHLTDLGDLTKTIELRIQDECLNPDPKMRPKLSSLLDDRLFRNDFLTVVRFLQDITLKTDIERKVFFSDLLQKLLSLPEEVVAKRLAQPLLCRFVLLDPTARESLIPHLLTPCQDSKRSRYTRPGEITPVFTEDVYKSYIIPELYKIFHCHDYYIRMVLLTYFSEYVHLFDKSTLEEVIFPQVLLGVRDVHDDLAALSLRALADLIPILGRDVVIGGKSKVYFSTGSPKFDKTVAISQTERFNGNSGMGNILLKDLAKISSSYKHSSVETDDDKERKKRERDARREEAKRKRELRKMEKLKSSQVIETSIDKENHDIECISPETLPAEETVQNENMGVDIPVAHRTRTFSEKEKQNGESHHHAPSSANQNEDWSDWDDIPEDENDSIDSFSQQKSPDPLESNSYIHSSSVNINNENLPFHLTNQHNTSVLSQTSSLHSEQTTKHLDQSQKIDSGEEKNVTKKGKGMSLKGSKRIVPKKKETLGSEFDIKSIEIDKTEAPKEFDFFAEMAPEIKPAKIVLDVNIPSEEKEEESKNSSDQVRITKNQHLSYQAADIDTVDSWGDDLEWGEGF